MILEGTTSIERAKRAETEASARGLTMVPPFDHEWIIEGQGTSASRFSIRSQTSDMVVVPVGGGGLASGVGGGDEAVEPARGRAWLASSPPAPPKMSESLEAGQSGDARSDVEHRRRPDADAARRPHSSSTSGSSSIAVVTVEDTGGSDTVDPLGEEAYHRVLQYGPRLHLVQGSGMPPVSHSSHGSSPSDATVRRRCSSITSRRYRSATRTSSRANEGRPLGRATQGTGDVGRSAGRHARGCRAGQGSSPAACSSTIFRGWTALAHEADIAILLNEKSIAVSKSIVVDAE